MKIIVIFTFFVTWSACEATQSSLRKATQSGTDIGTTEQQTETYTNTESDVENRKNFEDELLNGMEAVNAKNAEKNILTGMEANPIGYERGRFCYTDSDCNVGEMCLPGIDTTGISPLGFIPGARSADASSRGGILEVKTCGQPNYQQRMASSSPAYGMKEAQGIPHIHDKKNAEIAWNLPAYLIPGMPSIFCNNPTISMSVGEIAVLTVSGTTNELFNVTIPTSSTLFIKVKDIRTREKVAGTYEFLCDEEGTFKVKFAIEVNDGLQSIQKAINICMAQFECDDIVETEVPATDPPLPPVSEETTTTTTPSTTTTTPSTTAAAAAAAAAYFPMPSVSGTSRSSYYSNVNTQKQLKPNVSCKGLYRQHKVGTTTTISVYDDIVNTSAIASTADVSMELRLIDSDIQDTSQSVVDIAEYFSYTCDEPGTHKIYFVASAVDLNSAQQTLAICPAYFECTENRAPVVVCNSNILQTSGSVGEELVIDVANPSNNLFTAQDPDGDHIYVGLQDNETKQLLWSISHECKSAGVTEKTFTVSAFDGESSSVPARCMVTFACV